MRPVYIWVCAKLTRFSSGTEVKLSALVRRLPFRRRSGAARSGAKVRVQSVRSRPSSAPAGRSPGTSKKKVWSQPAYV